MPRVLISTITPISGGVPTMTRFVVATLRDRGYEPVLAQGAGHLRRPGHRGRQCPGGHALSDRQRLAHGARRRVV